MTNEQLNSQTTESLLDSLSLELIRDNILSQISTDFVETTTDFFSIVRNKFNYIINSIDDEDTKAELKHQMIEFCELLIGEMDNKFNLCIDFSYDSLTTLDLFENLYDFFILRRKNLVEDFVKSYIEINKSSIISALGIDEKSKDITTTSNKRKGFDKVNIPIISNINEIINFVIDLNINEDEFLEIINDGDVIVNKIIGLRNDSILNGAFVSMYLQDIIGEYSNEGTTDIRNRIRNYFYK